MTKRILLTGAGSYIGMQFTDWLAQHPDKYEIKTVDMSPELFIAKNQKRMLRYMNP